MGWRSGGPAPGWAGGEGHLLQDGLGERGSCFWMGWGRGVPAPGWTGGAGVLLQDGQGERGFCSGMGQGSGDGVLMVRTPPPGEVQIPGPPTNVHASETSRTYVVLSWDPPEPRGKEPLMYFIEKVCTGRASRSSEAVGSAQALSCGFSGWAALGSSSQRLHAVSHREAAGSG